MKKPKTRSCLVPFCAHGAATRGLCHNHYGAARMLVANNKTTWEELVQNGKALKTHNPDTRKQSELRAWFLDKTPSVNEPKKDGGEADE